MMTSLSVNLHITIDFFFHSIKVSAGGHLKLLLVWWVKCFYIIWT